jgi:hypothetical protein
MMHNFRLKSRVASAALAALLAAAAASPRAAAQSPAPAQRTDIAAATAGTRFLVRLESKLSSRKDKAGKKFKVKSLEPLQLAGGAILPAGLTIQGRVTRIEPAAVTGRARMWLVFDEMKTPDGKIPIVAEVVDVPGDHSVRASERKEGEIATRTSQGRREVEAAVTAAAIGAAGGAAAGGGKGAAIGAGLGALAGYLISSGMGQELQLDQGAKLELELARPLYLARR